MYFRFLNAAGAVCCEKNTVAELCTACRSKAKAENLANLSPALPTLSPPRVAATAADEEFAPPTADDVAQVIAARAGLPAPRRRQAPRHDPSVFRRASESEEFPPPSAEEQHRLITARRTDPLTHGQRPTRDELVERMPRPDEMTETY